MSKRFLVYLIMGLMSACVAGIDDEIDVPRDDVDKAMQVPNKAELESCKLADNLDDGELATASCLLRAPINARGDVASRPLPPTDAQACSTYYGTCSGFNGCSRATGGGWQYTACGGFLYAWMTVCNGYPSGWGNGVCFW